MRFPGKETFRQYLLAHRPTMNICKSGNCPLAQYLVDHGAKMATVDGEGWIVDDGKYHLAPRWVGTFIDLVDNFSYKAGPKKGHRKSWRKLTVKDILECLDAA